MEKDFDIIVIGAGASGLNAALELALTGKKTAIIEAKDRIGGRIFTIHDNKIPLPVELGAEFVHGDLKHTKKLLRMAKARTYELNGDIWRKEDDKFHDSDFIEDYSILHKKFRELDHDMPVKEFCSRYLNGPEYEDLRKSLESYVEGYYAADPELASTLALKTELEKSSDKQYRIEGGYEKLIDFFRQRLEETGVQIWLSSPVTKIKCEKDSVIVESGETTFRASMVLVTVSLGVLRSENISFYPAIPDKINAAKKMGFGNVVKVNLFFSEAFWKKKEFTDGKDLSHMQFLYSEEVIPTWWTAYPEKENLITGWLGGPDAERAKDLTEEVLKETAISSLARIFKIDPDWLHSSILSFQHFNWSKDPFTLGGYSFETLDAGRYRDVLKQPVDNKIFFAGEALHEATDAGTVESALVNGRDTAHNMVALFKK